MLTLAVAAPAGAVDFPVTTTADTNDGCNAAGCSLREAIAAANLTALQDSVTVPAGTYSLTLGELQITQDLIVTGAGDATTTVRSTGPFRVICITGLADVRLTGVTISGGRGAASGGCADAQGGGIHDAGTGNLEVLDSTIEGNSSVSTQGGGGGIFKATGGLTISDTAVGGNSATATNAAGSNGGGGVRWLGTSLTVERSEISFNTATVAGATSGGGGVYAGNGGSNIANVTFAANSLTVSGAPGADVGGGAFYARNGGGLVDHATFADDNAAGGGSGAAIASGTATDVQLRNSVIRASNPPACAAGDVTSLGGNVDVAASCAAGGLDRPNTVVPLGLLAENGSDNGTRTHELLTRSSPAVEFAQSCLGSDQRGVGQFGNCDSGAYEFDGRASAAAPPCSPTGDIPVNLEDPPGGDVEGLIYTLNGGGEQVLDTGPATSGPFTTTLRVSEGRYQLVYRGQWTNGIERGKNAQDVLVDKTRPRVAVQNPEPFQVFVIKRRINVNVAANDALSGLVSDPSGRRALSTAERGAKRFNPTATDLCANQAAAPFDYRVLAPGLGIRTVLERVRGRVVVKPAAGGSGARASQKGQRFTALREPRELRVRSLIDTRRGTARLTSSRDRSTAIQDGQFVGGVFQVLQSRKRSAKGLTELRLKGSSFKSCRRGRGIASAAQKRRVIRRLRGNARGRFRTRGRFSAATVRGTVWTVEDRCDGTLTKVSRGKVAVRDFRRKKTIVVRAGRSHLARAP